VKNVKFGKRVKFIVNNDVLEEYDIASDVQQLSQVVDIIKGKSNGTCVSDLLANIQSSFDTEPA
jgi:hypothetical protein